MAHDSLLAEAYRSLGMGFVIGLVLQIGLIKVRQPLRLGTPYFCQVVFRFMTCSLNACLFIAPTRGAYRTKPFIFAISVISVTATHDLVIRFENAVSLLSIGI